jgi:hypothetical protein
MVSVDRDSAKAKDAVRPMVATYLANFPNIARESGPAGELLDTIGKVYAGGRAAAAAAYVAYEIVTRLACAGTSDECRTLSDRVKMPASPCRSLGFSEEAVTSERR